MNINFKNKHEKSIATKAHFDRFKKNIRGRTGIDLETTSDDQIWSLGQHFGLFTPLLDWTHSPYVALFFSLFGPCKSGMRSLWAIVKHDIDAINIEKKRSEKVYIIDPLTHYNDRLANQRGLFLKIPINTQFEKWVKKSSDQGWITMYKIDYPDQIRNEMLAALNNMNINHLSLFPDLNGSSIYTNNELELEPYLIQEQDKIWKESSNK